MNKNQKTTTTKITAATALDKINAILATMPTRNAILADGKTEKRLENASEALGTIAHAGLMTMDTALPLMENPLLATMRPFLNAFLNGRQEKAPAIRKGELAAQNAAMAAELADLKAKLKLTSKA